MVLNFKLIAKVIAAILMIIAVCMIPAAIVSLIYGEHGTAFAFLQCLVPMGILGFLFSRKIKPHSSMLKVRDGLFIVAVCWILATVLGSLPYLLSGSFTSFADAVFESASSFSTTGATVIEDLTVIPKGLVFWRSFSQWLGGMGILIIVIALLPALGIGGQRIISAESPGPVFAKLTSKLSDSAKILYVIYLGLTALAIILFLACGLNLYDVLILTFSAVSTGGFSNYNDSLSQFSIPIHYIAIFFMLTSSINFNLYYALIRGKRKEFYRDYELRGYLIIILAATTLITVNLWYNGVFARMYDAFHNSLFHVVSIITSTGFAATDFNIWPTFSKLILFLLMFTGACSSSTSGGIKIIRILILFQLIKRGVYLRLHPRAVVPVKIQEKAIPANTVSAIVSFSVLYIGIFFLGTLILSWENYDIFTTASAVASCLGNSGPGFELIGPLDNYNIFSGYSKLLLSGLMLVGRLELFTILLLFTPSFWNPDR